MSVDARNRFSDGFPFLLKPLAQLEGISSPVKSIGHASTASSVDDVFSKLVHKSHLQNYDNYDESPRQFPMNLRNGLDQEIGIEEESFGQYPQDDHKENMINQYYDHDASNCVRF